jgi:hypothetical protein
MDGSTVAWVSSDPSIVTTAGIISRPVTGDANVTLAATITLGTASDTKLFPVTVKAQMTDAQAVAAAKAALAIGYAAGDSAASVIQNLTLTATGVDGSTIAWAFQRSVNRHSGGSGQSTCDRRYECHTDRDDHGGNGE